ncbi:glycosyltransferase [bacterium]|nr:glycosyltransferase [bacterium]
MSTTPETSSLQNGIKKDNPRASVIVVTRNRADSLERALRALQKLDYPNYEILVVDNDSKDNTTSVIEQYGAKRVFSPSRFGIGYCRRRGVESAQGEIIAFCDDDCVPASDWLSCFVERFNQEPDVHLLGGQVINIGFPDKDGYGDAKRYKGRSKLSRNGRLVFVEDPKDAEFFGNMNLAFRKKSVVSVGGYDPFFNVMAEIDLQVRLRKNGFKISFEPRAISEHHYTGVHLKGRHFFHGPQLVRLYLCLKHFRPEKTGDWFRFLGYEIRLLSRDLLTVLRKSGGAVLKGQFSNLLSVPAEGLRAVSARLAIPWLLWRARSAR